MAERLLELGCDSICIKDMAALLKPQPAYDLVKAIKQTCGEDTRVHVHVHATTGVTMVSLMKAIEAGADCVDTAISSLSLGPGHNPTESLTEMLEGTGYSTRLDKKRLLAIKTHFDKIRPRYRKEFLSNITGVDTEIFDSQIPGGMISNMESQLKQQGAGDRCGKCWRGPAGAQGRRLSAAGNALQPDRRHAGGLQRDDGPVQGVDRRVRRPDAGLLRRDDGPARPSRGRTGAKQTNKQPISTRPADQLKPEWQELRSAALALEGCNGPTKTCSPMRCFRA
jgi:methylmalonyl-CoA carboxyltransferase 5S subunit